MTQVKIDQNSEVNNVGQTASSRLTSAKCPHLSSRKNEQSRGDFSASKLVRASEVAAACPDDSALIDVLDWVHGFLAQPHADLGRKGPVCPFVPVSLELDCIWLSEVSDEGLDKEKIAEIISGYRELFFSTPPNEGPEMINKAIMVVFPNLGEEGAKIVDEVQFNLKKHFVDRGLMLGEFHSKNESPGLRNEDFRPLRSPIPMLVIRHMVDSDLPFLLRSVYPANDRASFLRSYLSRLRGGSLSTTKFNQALEGVIEAEIQKWVAAAVAGQLAVRSELSCAKCVGENKSTGVDL